MNVPRSVGRWIHGLKYDDPSVTQAIWDSFHVPLVRLARQNLRGGSPRHADEEDVVQNAFLSFFRGLAAGRFPQLNDRKDVWRLLVVLTKRRAIDQTRRDRRRDVAATRLPDHAPLAVLDPEGEGSYEQLIARGPSPELVAQQVDQFEFRLRQLGDSSLRQIALGKSDGFTNGEIARQLGCSRRTVIRKLEIIRFIWTRGTAK